MARRAVAAAKPQPRAVDARAAPDGQGERPRAAAAQREHAASTFIAAGVSSHSRRADSHDVEIGDRPADLAAVRIVDVRARLAVHRHVTAQQHDVARAPGLARSSQRRMFDRELTLPGYCSIRLMKMLGSLIATNRPVPRSPATTTAPSSNPITVVAPSTR